MHANLRNQLKPEAPICSDPDQINYLYASANDLEDRDVFAFPQGSGSRVGAGTGINYINVWVHIPNLSNLTDGWSPRSQMKFKIVTGTEKEQPHSDAGSLILYVMGTIPPLSDGCVTGSYLVSELTDNVQATGLFPHSHAHGTRFQAWLLKKDGERVLLFDKSTLGRERVYPFDPIPVSTGDKFVVRCSYRNTLNETLLVA